MLTNFNLLIRKVMDYFMQYYLTKVKVMQGYSKQLFLIIRILDYAIKQLMDFLTIHRLNLLDLPFPILAIPAIGRAIQRAFR